MRNVKPFLYRTPLIRACLLNLRPTVELWKNPDIVEAEVPGKIADSKF